MGRNFPAIDCSNMIHCYVNQIKSHNYSYKFPNKYFIGIYNVVISDQTILK